MKVVPLEFVFESPDAWSGWADLGSEISPEPYAVFASSYQELQELTKEFIVENFSNQDFKFQLNLTNAALEALKNS